MYNLLEGLKYCFNLEDITTDNVIFRLHNIFTTVLLLTCSLIITANQFVGNPIYCTAEGTPSYVINSYCWITSTYTMPDAFRRAVGVDVAHPGVANDFNDEDAKKYYTYYQWVCFVLFFQAALCYIPKCLWDAWEGNLLHTIIMGLNVGMLSAEEKDKRKKVLIDYLLKHINRHNMYVIRYWLCEFLCLVNVIGQLYMMNSFFDGEFISYGLNMLSFSDIPQEDRLDPMVYVFPRITKCVFHKYGPSGTIEKHDSLCVLPLNIVNEKTYIFIWFWFVILANLLTCLLLYRTIIFAVPSVRFYLLHARNRGTISREVAAAVCHTTDIGDWWVLYMLSRNIDPLIYREVIEELAERRETAARRISSPAP